MKLFVKLLAAVLSVALFLSACGGSTIPHDDNAPPTPSEQGGEELKPETPSEQPQKKEPSPYGDLLSQIGETGKNLVALGDLKKGEYSEALAELEAVLKGYSREVSLTVYSLDDYKALYYNTSSGIFSACAVKAPYSLYCCKQMESGKGTLDTEMVYEKKHYETGTGDMQYSPLGTTFDMRTIINKSMSISDNVGYLMQVDYFGREGYNSYVSSLGCDSLKIKPTVWSLYTKSHHLAVAWREIYRYFKTETELSRFLYSTCTNTANNYATAALKDIDISHKQGHNRTGDWKSYSDAGIVWNGDNPYIIVVLTNAPGPSSSDAEFMAKIINIVHNKLINSGEYVDLTKKCN